MGYTVCWTCRGLLTYDNDTTLKQTANHFEQCCDDSSSGTSLLEHYVCDRADFNSLKQIKKCLYTEGNVILKRKKELLGMGFSLQLIDLLLSLNKCTTEGQDHFKNNTANKEKKVVKNNIFQVLPQNSSKTNRITIVTPNEPYVLGQDVKKRNCMMNNDTFQMSPNNSGEASHITVVIPNKSNVLGNDAIGEIDIPSSDEMLLTQEEKDTLASQCVNCMQENINKLSCKLCGYISCSSKLMLRHLSSHDNGKAFVCTSCDFSTLLRSTWNRHQCRKSEKILLCEICSETFDKKSLFIHHLATQHKITGGNATKLFKCNECPYVGRDMTSLSDHQRKHTGEYFVCDRPDCTFKTPYKRSLQQHFQQKHALEKNEICHVCGFQTRHVTSLRKHMKIHEGTKQHKCDQCSFSSHNKTDVVLHTQRKHLKEKKYSCSQCSFQTGYAMALKKHIARHEKMRNEPTGGSVTKRMRNTTEFICAFCNKVYATIAKLKNHIGQCSQYTIPVQEHVDNVYEVFDKTGIYFDSHLDVDMSEEVYSITSGMLNVDDVANKNTFTPIVEDPLESSELRQDRYSSKKETVDGVTCKGRNPMLAETTRTLAAERDSPLLENSLFNFMSDFPPPPSLNRSQSASTLMFASLSPHLVDRPLTPDIFSENPASSFFQSLSRNLDHDNLTVSSLNQSFSTPLNF